MTVETRYPTEWDESLDISNVRKHNWKTLSAREKWYDILGACRRAYPRVELRAVAHDDTDRRVAGIDRGQLRNDAIVNDISELGLAVETNHATAWVATDADAATSAAEAHDDGDHDRLGELLGYPSCCREFYTDHPDCDDKQTLYEVACNSPSATASDDENQQIRVPDADPLLNITWAFLGWRFISHVPCSFECEASHEVAATHGSIYRDIDLGDEAEALWEFLGTPTTWSGYHGISKVLNGYLIGSTNAQDYWDEKEVVLIDDHAAKLLD